MMKRVVVFGGNGFVGSHCLQALGTSDLVSISRSGTAPKHLESTPWAKAVHWAKGDCLDPTTYAEVLKGAHAVIISVGSPPVPTSDVPWQLRMNGTSNCEVIQAAAEAGVPRVVLVNATTPTWAPEGYREGKAMAEACASKFVDEGGGNRGALVLKPGAIYGTRHTSGGLPIPLGLVLGPASWLLGTLSGPVAAATAAAPGLLEGALVPPAPVERLAAAAAEFALADGPGSVCRTMGAFELAK